MIESAEWPKLLLANLQYLFVGLALALAYTDLREGLRTKLKRYYVYAASRLGFAIMIGTIAWLIIDVPTIPVDAYYAWWLVGLILVTIGLPVRIWELRQLRKPDVPDLHSGE